MRIETRNAIMGLVSAAGVAAALSSCAVSFSEYYEGKGGAGGTGSGAGTNGALASNGSSQSTAGHSTTSATSSSDSTTSTSSAGGAGGAGGVGSSGSTSTTGGPIDRDWPNWKMPNSLEEHNNQGAPNVEIYHDNLDGTVTDIVTGLMWQKVVDPGSYTQPQAVAYCATTLNMSTGLGGHTDWRLPTRIELVSLLDFSVGNDGTNPAINAVAFPNTPRLSFWSATPDATMPTRAWSVSFDIGTSDDGGTTGADGVRCVR